MPSITREQALEAAWTYCAPGRNPAIHFGRGFWPDVARVAIEIFSQQTITPELDFRPTQCLHGNSPEPTATTRKKSTGKISRAEKAANTARLLAMLSTGEPK